MRHSVYLYMVVFDLLILSITSRAHFLTNDLLLIILYVFVRESRPIKFSILMYVLTNKLARKKKRKNLDKIQTYRYW